MVERILKGRGISEGAAEGRALVSREPISFYGGVDPNTGIVIEKKHELEGKCVKDKILVFPSGKGSTVGAYTIYQMSKKRTAPLAMINIETEGIIAAGCILAGIPLVDMLEKNPIKIIENGDFVYVDGKKGTVVIKEKDG
ncbi:MAG: DUF126 domain-containing protein [Candidatus Hodarchaeota archaeon]